MLVEAPFLVPLPEDGPPAPLAPLLCAGAIGYRSLRLCQLEDGDTLEAKPDVPMRPVNAFLPILVLIFSLAAGMFITGEGDTLTDIAVSFEAEEDDWNPDGQDVEAEESILLHICQRLGVPRREASAATTSALSVWNVWRALVW